MKVFKAPIEKHRPVCVLIDRSKSVESYDGRVMNGINCCAEGVVEKMKKQVEFRKMTEMLVIQFDTKPEVTADFVKLDDLDPQAVTIAQAKGCTDTGAALLRALDMLDKKKQECKDEGEEYIQPLLFLITDGAPDPGKISDESQREAHSFAVREYGERYRKAAARIKEMEEADKLVFVAGGITVDEEIAADIGKLRELTNYPNRVVELDCSGDLSRLEGFFDVVLAATAAPPNTSPIDELVKNIARGKRANG